MKHYLQTFIGCFLLVFAFQASAQNNCPAYPSQSKWEKTCYISVNQPDPTASDRQVGKLYLPEATFAQKYGQATHKSHIPDNRAHWALGIAHAWNYARNIQKNTKNPKISYWMATPLQESEWRCDGEAQWGDNIGSPIGTVVQQGLWEDGCFQIEGINNASAYGALIQYYPQRFRSGEHSNLIGHDNFVTSTLVKTYYDLATERIATYRWGWDLSESVEGTCDPYAFDKLTSSAFNGGIYGFQGAQSFMTGQDDNCYWIGLPAATAGYSTNIGDLMAVLENNMTYPITTFSVDGSSFDGYYNEPIKWSDVLLYLNDIDDLYWEVDFSKEVTPKVKEAFEEIAGDTLTSINFMDIGNVIDVVIMALPKEDPMQVAITTSNAPNGPNGTACSGDIVPVVQIEIEGETTICSGQTTTLIANTGVTIGNTFKWKKGETIVSTEQEFIVTETTIGTHTYSLEICNENGCNSADCDITIEVEKCSTCDLTATATATNSTCTTSEDGKIEITTQNGKALYNVEYSSDEYDGEFELEAINFAINNIPSGFYEVKLTDLLDASCFAYRSVEVEATTENNEILVVDSIDAKNCTETLKASLEILEKPTCTYQVRVARIEIGWPEVTDTTYMSTWEKSVTAIISINDQTISSQDNIINYQWGENAWDIADFVMYDYEVETNDIIEFSLALDATPGSTHSSDYIFEIWNTETNQKVASYLAPTNSAVFGTPYKVGTHTVSCETSLPTYTYSWTPAVKNQINTNTGSTVDVDIHYANDVDYVVTATNTQNVQCVLTDTLTVKHNNDCSTCDDPSTITLDKTGTIELCVEESTILTTTITGIGDFVYDLYRGDDVITTNETGVFSLTEEGVYSVFVKDQSQPNDVNCIQSSGIVTIVDKTVPEIPVFTDNVEDVCEGTNGHVFAVQHNSMVQEYVWNYTGDKALINTNFILTQGNQGSEVITIDFAKEATSGEVFVQAKNECGLSDIAQVPVTVTKSLVPYIEIEASESTICKDSEVIFTIIEVDNEGVNPPYTWKSSIQGNVGTGENDLKLSNLQDGEKISVEVTSDMLCVAPKTVVSNEIEMKVLVCTDTELIKQSTITIYPNPTTGRLVVSANDEIQNIVVLSLNGRMLFETTNPVIDLKTYSTGVYLVRIITENTTQVVKVEKR